MSVAFKPVRIGPWDVPQSFVMAPLTRSRAGQGNAPTSMNAEYYRQRASAGLLITEGIAPSLAGQGYPAVPGLYTPAQVAGWRLVADEVHAAGGIIVAQLMHVGRVAHASNKDGADTIAPSAVQAPGHMFTLQGLAEHDVPRAIGTAEVADIVADYVNAARNAIAAGLDGVEIHGANGYLIHQFLDPTVNLRQDDFGGTPQNRARFAIDVVTAVCDAVGAHRVGLRLSPGHQFNGIGETPGADLTATYQAVVDGIAPLGLAYLSLLINPREPLEPLVRDLKARFDGATLLNLGLGAATSLETVEELLEQGLADAVVVGRGFLANPDLVERWRTGAALNEPDMATLYGGGSEGYTDYPTLTQQP